VDRYDRYAAQRRRIPKLWQIGIGDSRQERMARGAIPFRVNLFEIGA